ncbi:MAG: HAD-IIIC family phosphatase [Terriglobia bacterium]
MTVRDLNDSDYGALLQASRSLNPEAASQKVKLALLSDAATQRLVPLLCTLFHRQGVNAEIYEAPFDAIELEACDTQSGLYRFEPDCVAILNAVQALRSGFARRHGDASSFLNETADRTVRIWEAIRSRSAATVIQSNFVLPYERFFGNFDHLAPGSLYTVVSALNARIADEARQRRGVLINDVEAVASWVGRRHWFDERLWDMAKYLCALDYLPAVAYNLVDVVMATRGRVIKCIVLDLDNTLWGGVIGDDGLEGIQLSAHGDGEAFYRLQCYLRELLHRGILLAVCSKNEPENALLPFEKHPEMVLQREDFAAFVANWNDKAENIGKIRESLNIGFDSMVFLDDNPFERNLVRELLPDVVVPELPEDPADYVRAISELNLFETASFSIEDSQRVELYRQEAQRQQAQATFTSVEDFLQSLDMRIRVARFDSFNLPRIAQLMQRSNQFNLTTRRLSEAECEGLMNDPRWIPLYARLADRLGDHGLISVVVLEPREHDLAIRDWLMSCRVLGRGVEQYLMNVVFGHACRLGLKRVTGEYIATAKNAMVKDFFAQFGFARLDADHQDHDCWALQSDAFRPSKVFIRAVEAEDAAIAN